MSEIEVKRRSLSGQLRHLAAKLREGPYNQMPVVFALEALAEEHEEAVTPDDVGQLLAVATLYVDAFREDEMMTLPEKLRLQEVEAILERHGRRY